MAKVDGDTYLVDIYGLKPGNYYDVRVFAQNEQGMSPKPTDNIESVCAKKPLGLLFSVISVPFYMKITKK